MNEREALAENPLVLRSLKGDQRIVQPVGLPICLRIAPITDVPVM